MSLALPYPSMVFVPLDVLTADEMNHIVANYEFIANQFPITSDNIDWTTIEDIVTKTNGTAIKYQNGIMVAYKNFASGTLTTDGTYGITTWTYPVAFVEDPCVQVSNTRESNNYNLLIPRLNNITSSTYQATWTKITSSSTTPGITNTTLNSVSFYAIGRWK